ncbi:MAG: tetratricopeptide repeat protein [Bacteroidia bacterium]|nr:tetratricopeptide repeat protein [Bacteroidia bacterium]
MKQKTKIKLLFVLFVINAAWAYANATFIEANNLYAKGQYEEACNKYLEIEKNGQLSFELYYNLGNTYYRLNQLGPSILYYEKAKKINPTDADLLQNLKLAGLKTADRIDTPEALFFERIGLEFLYIFTPNQWAYLTLFLLFLATIFFVAQNRANQRAKQPLLLSGLFISLLFLIAFFLSWKSKSQYQNTTQAVVMSASVNSYSEPNNASSLLFTIHEGTLVEVKEENAGWYKIVLPTGVSGWVPTIAVRTVSS